MNEIRLEKTCHAYPEQYNAYKGTKRIGYVRLRWGHLTVDYLPIGRFSNKDIRLVDHQFEDNYKGLFDSEEERKKWLDKCKKELLKKWNEIKTSKKKS